MFAFTKVLILSLKTVILMVGISGQGKAGVWTGWGLTVILVSVLCTGLILSKGQTTGQRVRKQPVLCRDVPPPHTQRACQGMKGRQRGFFHYASLDFWVSLNLHRSAS